MKEKVYFKNRYGKKIAVVLEQVKNAKGLAFIMHGLGGFKEQYHIQTFAEAFLESEYNVVRFDATHTFGESEGNYEDATITNYYEDLEDVIDWAKSQNWYQEPFFLAGHSIGGISISLFAQKYPDKVKALAPISTGISGKLGLETLSNKNLREWKKSGWRIEPSATKPGLMKKLKWSHFVDDWLKYDLLPNANILKMPILLIVGENDGSTPVEHQKILYEKLFGEKELHIIKKGSHTFTDKKQLKEIKQIFKKWINRVSTNSKNP